MRQKLKNSNLKNFISILSIPLILLIFINNTENVNVIQADFLMLVITIMYFK